jgi:hypothetical protein
LLTTAPVLAYPQRDASFILDTDASLSGIGAVLSQVQDGEEKVIAYASKTLSRSQQRYCTTNRELLAVITFLKHFRHYLWGRKFLVRTDHASLIWLKNFKDPEGMVARWITIIDTYDFDLQHRKGSLHTNADGMSRIPRKCKRENCPDCVKSSETSSESVHVIQTRSDAKGCAQSGVSDRSMDDSSAQIDISSDVDDDDDYEEANWLDVWGRKQIVKWQNEDEGIKRIKQLKESSVRKPPRLEMAGDSYETKCLWGQWETLEIRNRLLCRKYVLSTQDTFLWQVVAPNKIRQQILTHLHNNRIAGHMGRERT